MSAILMTQLFDVTSDAIIIVDANQTIIRFNRGAERIFGYSSTEITGKPLTVLLPMRFASLHGDHIRTFAASDDHARAMGDRRSIFGLRKNNTEFPAAAGISKLSHADGPVFAVILRDVTDQRQLENEARTLSILNAVAAERSRLARDLHDAVTQSLFSANLMAEVLPLVWKTDPQQALTQIQDIKQLTRSALAEMRALLLELRPTAIMDAHLSDLLGQLAEATHSRSGIDVTVEADERKQLPGKVHVSFYRIAQEALHNVSKHSKARSANIQLSLLPRSARMLIHDNGRGFEYNGIGATHLGLRIMHERATEVGAKLQIESVANQGTDVLVDWSES